MIYRENANVPRCIFCIRSVYTRRDARALQRAQTRRAKGGKRTGKREEKKEPRSGAYFIERGIPLQPRGRFVHEGMKTRFRCSKFESGNLIAHAQYSHVQRCNMKSFDRRNSLRRTFPSFSGSTILHVLIRISCSHKNITTRNLFISVI